MRALSRKLALLSGLALLAITGALRAEAAPGGDSAHKEGDHPAHPAKYKATIHKDGKEEDRTFDLSKMEDAKALAEYLAHGHVEELKQDKPVNPLAISWDLGLWTIVVFLLLLFVLRKMAWGPMLEGLQAREKRIQA